MMAGTKATCCQRSTAAQTTTTKGGGVGRKVWANAALCALCGACATAASSLGAFAPHCPPAWSRSSASNTWRCPDRRKLGGEKAGDWNDPSGSVFHLTRRASTNGGDDSDNSNDDPDQSSSSPEGSPPEGRVPQKKNDVIIDEETGIEYDRKHERSVKERRAREKIDRIMSGPNPPFERDEELKKLAGGVPPPPSSSFNPSDADLEMESAKLESELFDAVSRQDFEAAASLKDELSRLHLDDCGSVLQANSAYYRAFSTKDYDAMSKLWLKDASVCCVHPSQSPLVGAQSVLKSWRTMFESDESNFRKCWMEPTNVRLLSVRGSTALLHCDEEVYVRRWTRGKRRKTELVNKLCATNVFRKVGGRWHLVHHHASWHPDTDAAKAALAGHNGKGGESLGHAGGPNLLGEGRTSTSTGGESGIGSDGILGLSDLLGGGGAASTGGAGMPSPASPGVRRIFMGSLSDLLNGGLIDASTNGGSSSPSRRSDDDEGPTVIRFTASSSDNEDDDDEDEDESVSVLKRWAKEGGDDAGGTPPGSADSAAKREDSAPAPSSSPTNIPKDALRQSCISALRKMCKQGSISPDQKRVLLTDIIACSAKGEFSLVEVAYELLCGEGDESDAETAMEEFADQCRSFAKERLSDRGYPSAMPS